MTKIMIRIIKEAPWKILLEHMDIFDDKVRHSYAICFKKLWEFLHTKIFDLMDLSENYTTFKVSSS